MMGILIVRISAIRISIYITERERAGRGSLVSFLELVARVCGVWTALTSDNTTNEMVHLQAQF